MTTWKERKRDYYLLQKRILSGRPAYKAHRREVYRQKRAALLLQDDYTAPQKGRPRQYSKEEALERKRESARKWARQSRNKNLSLVQENDNTNEKPSKDTD